MKTFGTLFSGFGGADIGMIAAGMTPAWGVELDPRVAEVANANLGDHVRVGDILAADPAQFDPVYALHVSPPCTRASVANSRAETDEGGIREAPLDIALAEKVIQFVEVLQPEIVTLENVWQYRRFQSWKGGKKTRGILQALWDLGYWVSVEHVNAADYGVPQTRKRMIVRAVRGGMVPHLPSAQPWIGWYAAIEDILDTLPPSEFAPWQLERLPATLGDILMAGAGNTNLVEAAPGKGVRYKTDPCHTVVTVTSKGGSMQRAFLLDFGNTSRSATTLDEDGPAMTIQSWHGRRPSHMPAAFLLGNGTRSAPQADTAPADTVTSNRNQTGVRAFIMSGQNSGQLSEGWGRTGNDPAFVVTAAAHKGMGRAFILSSNTVDGGAPATRDAADPALTVDTKSAGHLKSWLAQGRVVSMTPRALARFQSFPDWYALPESKTLACLGIGNAVPPRLMETVYGQLLEANNP